MKIHVSFVQRGIIFSIEKFIKELGIEPSREEKLKISKKDLPQEEMELVILSL
jgi:hypothetical protein